MNQNQGTRFADMDIGSSPVSSIPMEEIEVSVSAKGLLGDYAKAFVREAQRVNPMRASQVGLTEDEMIQYCEFLLSRRIDCVSGDCKDFRQLKALFIPSYLQYALSMIGIVYDRPMGIKLVPVMDAPTEMDLAAALQISEKIGAFERDLQIVQDAMPRSVEGDINVMGTALIAGFVRSYRKVEHPAATYVTVLLDMHLRRETALSVLYRIQYDDINFIQMALLAHRGIFQ